MVIIVNNRIATLKSGFSFDYVSENRLFMGRDGYTLSIVFPLKDCPENVAIFGHINRADVAKGTAVFECSIVDASVSLYGSLAVTKISETQAECQFSEGRCAQVATDPFEDTYINELDLGAPATTDAKALSPFNAWNSYDSGAAEVALPWVNEDYPEAPNNWAKFTGPFYTWEDDVATLSWQPYLIVIAKRVCQAIGYDYDFAEWEASPKRNLIVCNTLPASFGMPEYRYAMPEWTVSEFFEKLELFLQCEFNLDHKARTVTMQFVRNGLDSAEPVLLDKVVDSYSVDVQREGSSSCNYIGARRVAYAQCSHQMWNFYSCDWFVKEFKQVRRYATLADLIEANRRRNSYDHSPRRVFWGEELSPGTDSRLTTVDGLVYAADVDTYFVFRSIGTELIDDYEVGGGRWRKIYTQLYVLQPVNVFGSGSVDSDGASSEEIDIVPPCIMDTYVDKTSDRGYMMFLKPGDLSSSESVDVDENAVWDVQQPGPARRISGGAGNGDSSYYDRLYVAFWPGRENMPATPCPVIDRLVMNQDWTFREYPGFSMRINPSEPDSLLAQIPQIDARHKFKFSWIGKSIPNPRAIFHICGKRYVCEKITATFTEKGMSQMLKGEFYPLAER